MNLEKKIREEMYEYMKEVVSKLNVKILNNSVSVKKFSGKSRKNFVYRQNCLINGSIFNMYRITCLNRNIL